MKLDVPVNIAVIVQINGYRFMDTGSCCKLGVAED